jgi:dienelactone hydrolase
MKKRRLVISLVVVILLIIIPAIYLSRPGSTAQSQAIAAMKSSPSVTVSDDKWITFTPTESEATTGFIFYPGGRVEEDAYAPILHDIASEGYLVVNVAMPFDLAVFGINKAEAVIAAHPEIAVWAIGGHSLGGVMATEFAADNPDQIDGIALWASYPAESTSLAASSIQVISISGGHDGLSTPDKIAKSAELLPAETIWLEIEGGNHAQFGDYGPQSGDLTAEITPEEQQTQITNAMADFLSSLTP